MSTPNTRLEKWLHNRRFIASITDTFSDWLVVGAFYTALHCVEMLFEFDKGPPAVTHEQRARRLKTVNRYQKISRHYRPLWDASMSVRYYLGSSSWIDAKMAREIFVGHHLEQLELSVFKLMKIERPQFTAALGSSAPA